VELETIFIDNSNNVFSSASEALNHGAEHAYGKYLIFAHQDILLPPRWLKQILSIMEHSPHSIFGVAGKSKDYEGTVTNAKHGKPPRNAGSIQIKQVTETQTLDECILIIPKQLFETLKFDEETCFDWHLYGVDYCLSAKRLGYKSYVLPQEVYHRSPGDSFSERYFDVLKRVAQKHKKHVKMIYTTMGNWSTRRLPLQLFIHRVKRNTPAGLKAILKRLLS
jgi:GT2 family glycosyltransferase